MRLYLLYILCLGCLMSCRQSKPPAEEGNKPRKIVITGKLINCPPEEKVSIQHMDPDNPRNLETLELTEFRYIKDADSFYLSFELEHPMEIMMWFETMYASPGDSIHLVYRVIESTKNKHVDTLYTSGEHSGNYGFFWNTLKKNRNRFPNVYGEKEAFYLNDLDEYRKDCEKTYRKLMQSLEREYVEADLTQDALDRLKKYILAQYLVSLANPVAFGMIVPDHFPDDYLAHIDRQVLSDSLLQKVSSVGMERFLFALSILEPGITPYSPEHFRHTLELIDQYSKGSARDFLFYATVRRFTENKDRQFTAEMEAAYDQMLATVADSGYRQAVIRLGFNPNEAVFRASEAVQTIMLQDKQGGRITLGEMISRHLHQVVYIDIWASWCKPCRAEMPYAKTIREAYKDQPVSFVYLSIDKDKESWKKAAAQEQLQDTETNYVLEDPGAFAILRREFKFIGIPHYVLIDPKGNVTFPNAPRPSSDRLRTSLDNLLKAADNVRAEAEAQASTSVPPSPPAIWSPQGA